LNFSSMISNITNMTSNLPRLSIMTGMANAIQEAKVRPVLGPNF
jgi:hypothetical protein